MYWTENEIKLFVTKSDAEIAKITGRSLKAVQSKRYRVEKENEEDGVTSFAPGATMNKQTKIARLLSLCRRLKVRLFENE